MSATFLVACAKRSSDALGLNARMTVSDAVLHASAVVRQLGQLPSELGQIVISHLPLATVALVTLAIDRVLCSWSRAYIAEQWPKLSPLRLAPFSLTPQQLLQETELAIAGQIGDAEMRTFASAIIVGALADLKHLHFNGNRIADEGMKAFTSAIASGALPNLNRR